MGLLDDFFDAMVGRAKGRVALSNLYHDWKEERVPRSLIVSFLRAALHQWSGTIVRRAPEQLIHEVARSAPADYLVKGAPPLRVDVSCSRVMLSKDFVRDHVRYERLGWDALPDCLSDEQIRQLESRVPAENNWLPHERPLAWVTRTEELDSLRAGAAVGDLASLARDKLGLLHYLDECQLVEVRYPRNVIPANGLRPPTFLDSSPSLVYRSQSRGDGWGAAVDLSTWSPGLPEAVHEPIRFSGDFACRRVGWTNHFDIELDFDRVLDGAAYPWNKARHDELARWISEAEQTS